MDEALKSQVWNGRHQRESRRRGRIGQYLWRSQEARLKAEQEEEEARLKALNVPPAYLFQRVETRKDVNWLDTFEIAIQEKEIRYVLTE